MVWVSMRYQPRMHGAWTCLASRASSSRRVQVLGWGEIIGSVLLLIPRTAVRGGWFLVGIFVLAIVLHLLHGMFNVGDLVIYTSAAWAVAAGEGA